MQASGAVATRALLCSVFCVCHALGGRTECVHRTLTHKRNSHREPFVPGLYAEVSFNPATKMAVMGFVPVWWNHEGQPLVPFDVIMPGTKRPDYVLVNNLMRPPHADNINTIFDLKFPGDSWQKGQLEAYVKLCRNVEEISLAKCDGCGLVGRRVPWRARKRLFDDMIDELMKFFQSLPPALLPSPTPAPAPVAGWSLPKPSPEAQVVMLAVGLLSAGAGVVARNPQLIAGGATAAGAALWGLLGDDDEVEQ
jgi:hypothetical protein